MTKADQIRASIKNHDGRTIAEIATDTGFPKNEIQVYCGLFLKWKEVERSGNRGGYSYRATATIRAPRVGKASAVEGGAGGDRGASTVAETA